MSNTQETVSKPAIVGVQKCDPYVGGFYAFKSVDKVPLEVSILYPIIVRGELRWQPKETTEERVERINVRLDHDNKTKARQLVSKWKRDGKLKEITTYFAKKK